MAADAGRMGQINCNSHHFYFNNLESLPIFLFPHLYESHVAQRITAAVFPFRGIILAS